MGPQDSMYELIRLWAQDFKRIGGPVRRPLNKANCIWGAFLGQDIPIKIKHGGCPSNTPKNSIPQDNGPLKRKP